MTDDQRQRDFANRLSRIAQERGGPDPTASDRPQRNIADFDYNMPREKHPVRNGIIWALILAAAGTGGYYGWNALPPDLRYAITSLMPSSAEGDEIAAALDIPQTDSMSDQGPLFASPAVVTLAGDPLTLMEIATDADQPDALAQAGAIIPIVRNARCDLRDPLPAEKVVGVRIENALLPAPLHAFSNAQMAAQVLQEVRSVTQGAEAPGRNSGLSGEKTSLDVFVTDNSAPLYLVLQNMGPGVIWNLQPAPDVTIAHVAIIGSDFSGLANPQPDTTVEALLVGDFVPDYVSGADDQPRSCMVRPWRNPQPDWIGSRKAAAGSVPDQEQMSSYAKGHAAYNRWFRGVLGVDATANTVTARDAAHVLIGEKPAMPLAYRPLAGQDIHLMQADHVLTGTAAERRAASEALHADLLRAALGGDLAALDPPAMERVGQ